MQRPRVDIRSIEDQLNLKQLQIKSLLAITQAINNNISAEELFNMYRNFLGWEMGVEKMLLFVQQREKWTAVSKINFSDQDKNIQAILRAALHYKRTERIDVRTRPELKGFDVIIPVYHKEQAIAFVLIGDRGENEDFYNKIQFITTITNIIAVAIENKRLFKKQLHQERLNRELELAAEVQHLLIPNTFPASEDLDISGIYEPHSNVGGDYFDVIELANDKRLICIADVAGKGISAALLMSNFQASLHSHAVNYSDLKELVFNLNSMVYKNSLLDGYLTLFLLEYCRKTKTINYINAGHVAPFFYQNGHCIRLQRGTTVIGAFETLPDVQIGRVKIEHSALLFCFTDGLTDIKNNEGVYFDDEIINNFVIKHQNCTAGRFNEALQKKIIEFKKDKNYPDDIAILTCKFFSSTKYKKKETQAR